MLRNVTRRALNVLNSSDCQPIDLIDIQPVGATAGSILRYTSAGEDVTWNSSTYSAVQLSRTGISEVLGTDSGSVPATRITIENVDKQIATLWNAHEFEHAKCTVRGADRKLLDNALDAWTITVGEIRNAVIEEMTLSFDVVNVLGQLDTLMIPRRLWKPKCNYRFGETACGVDITASPFTISSTAQTGSTDSYVVIAAGVLVTAGSPADPTDYWAEGTVTFSDGVCGCQSRPIHRVVTVGGATRMYVRFPFLSTPGAGDGIKIRRGCRHTKTDCAARQTGGDISNYGGFEETPYGPGIKPVILHNIKQSRIWNNP